jgi:hypothetical protein
MYWYIPPAGGISNHAILKEGCQVSSSKQAPESPEEDRAQEERSGAEKQTSRDRTDGMPDGFSTSVRAAAEPLLGTGGVSPGQIIQALLKRHEEYGGGMTDELLSGIGSVAGKRQPVKDWLLAVRSLYDRTKTDVVDGRMLIIGFSILDRDIAAFLWRDGFLGAVVDELKRSKRLKTLDGVFVEEGLKKWHALEARLVLRPQSVPNHSDAPSLIDRLGREAFAEALTLRLRRIRFAVDNPTEADLPGEPEGDPRSGPAAESAKAKQQVAGPFMLHIHGPWGAGKSTLLGFMENHLRRPLGEDSPAQLDRRSWIVVDFNAWRHQRLRLPWWSLMDAVFRTSMVQLAEDGKQKLARRVARKERWWRFWLSKSHYLVSILLLLACVGLLLWAFKPWSGAGDAQALAQTTGSARAKTAGDWAKYMGALIALGGGIWTFVRGLCRSLMPGSEHAAEAFITCSADPLGRITDHFSDLIEWIEQPVAVFIDDLDRCQAGYAVELLEGTQTLFKKAVVTFVVAADRRWLCSGYETVYSDFEGTVGEPARPLGYLFLEKTFQLSVALPRLAPEVQERYLHYLLQLEGAGSMTDHKQNLKKAKQAVSKLKDERDILAELGRKSDEMGYSVAFRQAAVVRLAAPEVEVHTEHFLMDFAPFLEPNPRAMKRFVNAYAAQRALDILRGGDNIKPGVLALWTIVVLRWPLFASYLESKPEAVPLIGKRPQDSDEVPDRVAPLFSDNDVMAVFSGRRGEIDVGANLTEQDICEVSGLRTSATTDATGGPVA